MALVRVYCGLASAEQPTGMAPAGSWLTAAVVDDAGRLLDLCEISDDPAGYARLGVLLAERSGDLTAVAVAADTDQYTVTALLATAGRCLAFADDEAVNDYAERFADDESADEIHSPPAERRSVGLARALQAGAMSAFAVPAPRELVGYKPVLAAHAALLQGRQSTAVALREVLREVYPAALRAYPDPAEPVSLAVLDALPEPSLLAGHSNGRAREAAAAVDAIATRLASDGVADPATIDEAITALRVAAAETPRRNGAPTAMTAAVGETVRQAVAAVRACDAACETLVGTLTGQVTAPSNGARRSPRRSGTASATVPVAATAAVPPPAPPAPAPPLPSRDPGTPSRIPTPPPRRVRPAAAQGTPASPQPMMPPPVAPAPISPPPVAPAPLTPNRIVPAAAAAPLPTRVPAPQPGPPRVAPPPPPPPLPIPAAPAAARYDALPNRPVSPPPPPPPGITPIVPSQRTSTPVEAGEPFRATLTAAAINSAMSERQRVSDRGRSELSPIDAPAPPGFGAADVSIPVPAPRPPTAAPGSRANWPVNGAPEDRTHAYPIDDLPPSGLDRPAAAVAVNGGRVTPPWLADDLPPEPPTLRLVEPPLAERGLSDDRDALTRDDLGRSDDLHLDPPPLRLVEREPYGGVDDLPAAPISPVPQEGDGDLLIFAAARSAWFIGHPEEAQVDWSSSADLGWRAAEQAARPAVGAETSAGLPRRVPQANLVPGSPMRDERPLRIVRDAASIAAHTTGYFRGWRRGQEIGGYAVGGRPGRESAGGWDFSREHDGRDEDPGEYRSAGGYRS